MAYNRWLVSGYIDQCQTSGATVCTPVLRRHDSETLFLQIDYQCPPPRFALYSLSADAKDQIVDVHPKECDPEKQLAIFVLHGGAPIYGNLSENVARLERIAESDETSASAKVQLREMLNGASQSDAMAEIGHLIPDSEYRYFSAAMSADAVFQITMSKLKPNQDRNEAINVAHDALRVVHNWEIDKSRISQLSKLLEMTGLTFGQFSSALNSRRANILPKYDQNNLIEEAWGGIRHLSRQERRLARFLKIYVESPRLAEQILGVYTSPNYLETRALSEISGMVRDEVPNEHHRALQVAYFIPRLVNMEFGAQRGKLLYDLALELGAIPEIRHVLQMELERRGHTWSVACWADELNRALERV